MDSPRTRMYTHPFFEATPPGAAPGPPVNTGARVRHFRGCKKKSLLRVLFFVALHTPNPWGHVELVSKDVGIG